MSGMAMTVIESLHECGGGKRGSGAGPSPHSWDKGAAPQPRLARARTATASRSEGSSGCHSLGWARRRGDGARCEVGWGVGGGAPPGWLHYHKPFYPPSAPALYVPGEPPLSAPGGPGPSPNNR
jgi:hypothetical protein